MLLGACGGGGRTKEEELPKYYFSDNHLVLEDYEITITDFKILPPRSEGNQYSEKPAIAFWYDTKNLTDKELDPSTAWMFVFEAVQDNDPNAVNSLQVSTLPDAQFMDTQLQKIKKDGTVSNAVAYTLTDETTPVKLIAKKSIAGEVVGEQEYKVN